MKKTKTTVMSLSLATLLSACASGPYKPRANPSALETTGEAPVVLLNEGLRNKVAVDEIVVDRTPAGMLSLQANIRNHTDSKTLQIQVQTLYRNAANQVLYTQTGSEPAWDTMVLSPNETKFYTSQALTREASSATIRIRWLGSHR